MHLIENKPTMLMMFNKMRILLRKKITFTKTKMDKVLLNHTFVNSTDSKTSKTLKEIKGSKKSTSTVCLTDVSMLY